jgi:hypothetical protein
MNEPLLRELAALSGGAFFREEDLHVLPDTISPPTRQPGSRSSSASRSRCRGWPASSATTRPAARAG